MPVTTGKSIIIYKQTSEVTKYMDNKSSEIRIQKYFSDLGIMSRRAAEAEIEKGTITVNGKRATLGQKIVPGKDIVLYNDTLVGDDRPVEKIYIMFNKPRGVITSLSDECGRRCISDFTADIPERVYPVGRLDYNSDGLLILTNDGEFANLLTHPKHDIPKIYLVKVSGQVADTQLKKLTSPMTIDGYRLEPVGCIIESVTETSTVLRFTLHEGRNRQIRKMCEKVGLRILRLKRVAIGKVELGELPGGKWRMLTAKEIDYLTKK